MHLDDVPILFVLAGLVLYTVLGGADFGAGIWQLTAGRGERGVRIRDHAHHSMAPVWEANHVWLIFVLTVFWTCYPVAFGSIFTTLAVPLFLAGIGIVLRGAAYALRAGARTASEAGRIDALFAVSSLLTPFALGTVIGGIAARRVPVGNATGNLLTSWLNPTAILIGVIAVLSSAYLAAVYLAADAARHHEPELAAGFRARALGSGVLAGAVALAGIAVIHADVHALFHGLTHGAGVVVLLVSAAAGLSALALVWSRRFEPARYVAALAVAAIVAGWAIAQQPTLLPGLTIAQAAAPHDTLLLVTVAVLAGGCLLFPSLGLLLRLFLGGRLHEGAAADAGPAPADVGSTPPAGGPAGARGAIGLFLAGLALLVFGEAWWLQLIGVLCLLGCVVGGFVWVDPAQLARRLPE